MILDPDPQTLNLWGQYGNDSIAIVFNTPLGFIPLVVFSTSGKFHAFITRLVDMEEQVFTCERPEDHNDANRLLSEALGTSWKLHKTDDDNAES